MRRAARKSPACRTYTYIPVDTTAPSLSRLSQYAAPWPPVYPSLDHPAPGGSSGASQEAQPRTKDLFQCPVKQAANPGKGRSGWPEHTFLAHNSLSE